ncbi:cobalamin/Fe3+-siderophore ABC transporter ATPase [Halogeometricum pallidum JCM 14848]|uniref:Cobalamin import ATP-binding protein BtuD n=1 Tax=Halogeometricum pallidum JCM 14848 TaxID=1227487 RepID=M0DGZ3_HALPD|nr:ABC transporter ATP-binding protein [Halogeometricum pallidum]ELZ33982.1 cobalamin/Fe3+-siderophore ABC transporter ATPase [Halogeometricum pallidum JCM 14848]
MAKSEHEHTSATTDGEQGEERDGALVGDGLTLSYPTSERPVVECDRIDIPRGEITALVGPNGSGKSTLLKSLAKQLTPDSGSVLLDGKTIQEYDDKEFARELGLLSQENESPGSLTVEELVYHGRYPHRGFFEQAGEEDHAAVERAIDLAGVDHLREKTLGNLSGGQKQLAWIAMVLAQDTDVLLLDEPTTFLDLHHQLRVMETVRQLNERRDVTVAVVLHDIAQAARFADYLIALKDGEVYDWGPPREVVTEDLLADVFRVEAAVNYTPDPEIVPKHSL